MDKINRRNFIKTLGISTALAGTAGSLHSQRPLPPNIVVFVSDDQGYADVSYNPHHAKEVHTPNIDKLAKSGVIFTRGYTTGHVCSPTRAGLMTGRYQQRFGVYTAGEGGKGGNLKETFIPQYLKKKGYVSGAFGKWHLGLDIEYNAMNRGFDEFYGFMGRGAHDYFKLDTEPDDHPIYRGKKPIKDKGYLTTRITEEAVDFIKRNKSKPMFLYVAYNAVHSPPQAPEKDIKKFNTGDKTRNALMAMLMHLDKGVGDIVKAIDDIHLTDHTFFIYLSDNGGSKTMQADNAPLRGWKQEDYEGGVHVPFFAAWKKKIKPNSKCSVTVSSLDILPTVLAAAGLPLPKDKIIDGKDFMPAVLGKTQKLHDTLYWCSADGKWAIMEGDMKLVHVRGKLELFDIKKDLSEKKDLSKKYPEKVDQLTKKFDKWLDQMADPNSGAPKRWDPNAPQRKKKKKKKTKRK